MPRRFSNCLNTGKIRNITCKEELKAGQGMDREKRMRAWIRAEVMLLFIMMGAFLLRETGRTESMEQAVVTATSAAGKDYIKWVDFTVSYEALCQAYDWDVDTFDTEHHVETVVLLSHKKADSYIHIDVEFGEGEGKIPVDSIAKRAEAYKPKEKVTYKMIKEYIEAKYGFKVHTAYIAEVKRNLGLPMYDAPNAVEELKQPRKHPTPEKVEAIKDALRYFAVI